MVIFFNVTVLVIGYCGLGYCVNLCINDTIVIDRKTLTDRVENDDTVFIFQALSGG